MNRKKPRVYELGKGKLDAGNGSYHIQLLDWRGCCTKMTTKKCAGKEVRLIAEILPTRRKPK